MASTSTMWVYLLLVLAGTGDLQAENPRSNASRSCELPFEVIGNRCIFVNSLNSDTWDQQRYVCSRFGGDLVKIDDSNLLYYIVDYIQENGLGGVSYWIGTTDQDEEGSWKWIDGTTTRLGTPFWSMYYSSGDGYHQFPISRTFYNCGFLSSSHFYFFIDGSCSSKFSAICEK